MGAWLIDVVGQSLVLANADRIAKWSIDELKKFLNAAIASGASPENLAEWFAQVVPFRPKLGHWEEGVA